MCDNAPCVWKETYLQKQPTRASFSEAPFPFSRPWSTGTWDFSLNNRPLLLFLLGDWNNIYWSVFGRTDHKQFSSLYIELCPLGNLFSKKQLSSKHCYVSFRKQQERQKWLSLDFSQHTLPSVCFGGLQLSGKPSAINHQGYLFQSAAARWHISTDWLCRVPACRSCSCGDSLGPSY